MLRLGHGSSPAPATRDFDPRAQARTRWARGRRPGAGASRPGLRAHPRDLWPAAFSPKARELRHAPPHHPRAAAVAGYRGKALETAEAALPAADATALPRARRGYAQELRLHAAEDRLRPRPRERHPGAAFLTLASQAA